MTVNNKGFSLIELLAVMSLAGIMSVMIAPSLKELIDDSQTTSSEILTNLRAIRSYARVDLNSIIVDPISSTEYRAYSVDNCSVVLSSLSAAQLSAAEIIDFRYTANASSTFTTNWEVCFNQMGISDSNDTIDVTDNDSTEHVEILLGGTIRKT